MKYSIIVPVYNVQDYVAECIESVLNQTYTDWELILIDNSSTDNSRLICKNYYKKDSRISFYNKENEGPFSARNMGIGKARGKYCLFLDADDYWDSILLSSVDEIAMESDCDVIMFNMRLVYKNKQLNAPTLLMDGKQILNGDEMLQRMIAEMRFGSVALKAIKKEILLEANQKISTTSNYGEDLYQSIAVMLCAKDIYLLDKYIYNYRQRRSSSCHGAYNDRIENYFTIREAICDLLLLRYDDITLYEDMLNKSGYIYIAECIFNENNYRRNMSQKKDNLIAKRELMGMCALLRELDHYHFILYQKIRWILLKEKCFMTLIIIDRILMGAKKIVSLAKREKMYE